MQHGQEEPSASQETRERVNPHKIPSAATAVHPGDPVPANDSPEAAARLQPLGRAETSGVQSTSCGTPSPPPPRRAPVRRGRAGEGLTRSTKIITVIILSFRHITVIVVINSLNNSKGNYSNNNTTSCNIAITHRSNDTTSSKIPGRAREPNGRLRAPQDAGSALFISITTN